MKHRKQSGAPPQTLKERYNPTAPEPAAKESLTTESSQPLLQKSGPSFTNGNGIPSTQNLPKISASRGDETIVLRINRSRTEVLQQIIREDLAGTYEDAIMWLIDGAKERLP